MSPIWTVSLLACTGGEPAADPLVERSAAAPPAIVVVLVDSWRADAVPWADGSELPPWAAEATRFTEVRSPSSGTVPAVRSLLGATDPHAWSSSRSVPARLQEAGWQTHLLASNLFLTEAFGFGEGFTSTQHHELTLAELQAQRALELLETRDAPSLVVVQLSDLTLDSAAASSSWPSRPPPSERLEAPLGELPLRSLFGTQAPSEDEGAWLADTYAHRVSLVLPAIDTLAAGLRPQDTLVLTAPHGESLGEHGLVGHGFHLTEDQLRVPLMISGPGWEAREEATGATLADLGATVLGLAELPLPEGATGRDLREAGGPSWRSRPQRLGPTLFGPARSGLLDGHTKTIASAGEHWTIDLAVNPEEQSPTVSADWTGAARSAWATATGEQTRRVWHLQVQPWDDSLEPLTWSAATEVTVRHPAGFVELWAPPMPIHKAPWGFEADPTQVTVSSANGRLPRELLLQPAAPAELEGLELSVVVEGRRYDGAWAGPEGEGEQVRGAVPQLVVGPRGKEVSLSVRWAPPPPPRTRSPTGASLVQEG